MHLSPPRNAGRPANHHAPPGRDRATGTGEVVMNGSKEFKGTTIIDADMEGMKVRVTAEYKGKFVSADCGKAPLMKWEGFTEKPRK
jgi:hypothetical protein